MLKRTGLFFLAAAMLLAIPAFAQDTAVPAQGEWTVSLFDQTTGTVTRVAPTGAAVGEVTLPVTEGFDFLNYNLAISPSGDRLAYLVSQMGDGMNPVQPSELVIYDANAQSVAATVDLNANITREGINAAGTSLHFSADGSRVMFGTYIPVEGRYTLEFTALDAATGQMINTLRGDAIASLGVTANSAYYTQVIAFEGDMAMLVLHPVFIAQDVQPVAVQWNVVTNEVAAAPDELVNVTDYNPATDEAILLTYDQMVDTLAEGEIRADGFFLPPNTIQIFDPVTGAAQTLFAEDSNLISAKFVQNGERILAVADSGARGILLDRNGSVLREFTDLPGMTFTFGTPEGFIYADPMQPGTLVSVLTGTEDYTPVPFYTSPSPYNSLTVQG